MSVSSPVFGVLFLASATKASGFVLFGFPSRWDAAREAASIRCAGKQAGRRMANTSARVVPIEGIDPSLVRWMGKRCACVVVLRGGVPFTPARPADVAWPPFAEQRAVLS